MNLRDLATGSAELGPYQHFPAGDLYDPISRSQAYFHIHRQGDHGHFHLFLRQGNMPAHIHPVVPVAGDGDAPCHLGAVELDADGRACGLFTTNRWVTGEAWHRAEDMIRVLPLFQLVLPQGWAQLGRSLTELVRGRRGELAELLRQRDRNVEEWQSIHPDMDVYEDEGLEITSYMALT